MGSARRKVLLIGWDGADWQHIHPLLDAGQMPTLERLINTGVMGNLATLQPVLSPMLWNSVATGKYASKHGIHGFIEPDPVNGGARPATSYSRSTRALWNMLTLSGLRSNVVGWWASHPAEAINGSVVTNSFSGIRYDPKEGWRYPEGTFHPPELGEDLARFKIFPNELTSEHLLPFIPRAAEIDQDTDPRLSQFAKVLAETASIQAVATSLMEHEEWDFSAIYFDCIDHLCHGFMKFYPPRLPFVTEEDFEIFKQVIPGAYRFHDMMLERQLQLAGPDTTVIICSDHGFDAGPARVFANPREPAGPAEEHRDLGMLVISGPGIRQDERIYGASLIDIAPTVLALFGLPLGEDMDGRVLAEAFEDYPSLTTIPSWDEVAGECGMHSGEQSLSAEQSDELMQQFAALGYIDDPDKDRETQGEDARVEQLYNLARQHMWLQENERALPLCRELVDRRSWETRFITQLAECTHRCGYHRQAVQLLELAFDLPDCRNLTALMTLGKALVQLGEHARGLEALERAEALHLPHAGSRVQLGDIHLRYRRLEDARRNYAQAIVLDEDNALAYQGLSSVYRRQGDNDATIAAALEAVGRIHRLPQAHFNLGMALARSGQLDRAIKAFETTLRFNPNHYNAHRWLARLYRRLADGGERYIHHFLAIEKARERFKQAQNAGDERSEVLFDLSEIPDEQNRARRLELERPPRENPLTKSDKTFVLVSGLPRSGTSLMMQMLEAGGLPPKTDGLREADDGNPRGYYEWEELKQIGRYRQLMEEEGLQGLAIKAVSALLQKMPQKYHYKVIFMTRPIDEVVRSQNALIEQSNGETSKLDVDELALRLDGHRGELIDWLAQSEHMDLVTVDYHQLLQDPTDIITQLSEFLGEQLPDSSAMASAIEPSLYRNRQRETAAG